MRRIFLSSLLSCSMALSLVSAAPAEVVDFGFDPDGGAAFSNIDTATWTATGALLDDLDDGGLGPTFELIYASQFFGGTLNGLVELGADAEQVLVIQQRASGVFNDNDTSGGPTAGDTLDLTIVPSAEDTNFIKIFDTDGGVTEIFRADVQTGATLTVELSGPGSGMLQEMIFGVSGENAVADSDYFDFGLFDLDKLLMRNVAQSENPAFDDSAVESLLNSVGISFDNDVALPIGSVDSFFLVPEPASVLLSIIALTGLVYCGWHRRRVATGNS